MSKSEAIVLINQMQNLLNDMVDLTADQAPQHVIMARHAHCYAIEQAINELKKTYGVSL